MTLMCFSSFSCGLLMFPLLAALWISECCFWPRIPPPSKFVFDLWYLCFYPQPTLTEATCPRTHRPWPLASALLIFGNMFFFEWDIFKKTKSLRLQVHPSQSDKRPLAQEALITLQPHTVRSFSVCYLSQHACESLPTLWCEWSTLASHACTAPRMATRLAERIPWQLAFSSFAYVRILHPLNMLCLTPHLLKILPPH